jgi:hypothetical protein
MKAARYFLSSSLLLLALSACGMTDMTRAEINEQHREVNTIGNGDLLDASTTAYGLSQGFVEANPLIAGFGSATPLAGIALKSGYKHLLVELGVPGKEASFVVDRGGYLAGCANIMTLTGAAPPVALVAGIACAAIYTEIADPRPKAVARREARAASYAKNQTIEVMGHSYER